MHIEFTQHAKDQMDEREVDAGMIKEVTEFPDELKKINDRYYAIKQAHGRRLKVVYTKERHIKIITVFWI